MRITPHFTMEELTRSATAERFKLENTPNDAQTANLIELAQDVLEPARVQANMPFLISSGFRSKAVNDKVGGVKNSYHLLGRAVDIIMWTLPQAYAVANILARKTKCDLAIVERKNGNIWVHVQTSINPRHKVLSILK